MSLPMGSKALISPSAPEYQLFHDTLSNALFSLSHITSPPTSHLLHTHTHTHTHTGAHTHTHEDSVALCSYIHTQAWPREKKASSPSASVWVLYVYPRVSVCRCVRVWASVGVRVCAGVCVLVVLCQCQRACVEGMSAGGTKRLPLSKYSHPRTIQPL